MPNPIHLHAPGHQAVLRRHFGNPGTTIVLGEVPVAWNSRQRRGVRIPDLLIAFNIDRPQIIPTQVGRILRGRGFSLQKPVLRASRSSKKAVAEGRNMLWAGESGFYLLPALLRTWTPAGRTPLIRRKLSHERHRHEGGRTLC